MTSLVGFRNFSSPPFLSQSEKNIKNLNSSPRPRLNPIPLIAFSQHEKSPPKYLLRASINNYYFNILKKFDMDNLGVARKNSIVKNLAKIDEISNLKEVLEKCFQEDLKVFGFRELELLWLKGLFLPEKANNSLAESIKILQEVTSKRVDLLCKSNFLKEGLAWANKHGDLKYRLFYDAFYGKHIPTIMKEYFLDSQKGSYLRIRETLEFVACCSPSVIKAILKGDSTKAIIKRHGFTLPETKIILKKMSLPKNKNILSNLRCTIKINKNGKSITCERLPFISMRTRIKLCLAITLKNIATGLSLFSILHNFPAFLGLIEQGCNFFIHYLLLQMQLIIFLQTGIVWASIAISIFVFTLDFISAKLKRDTVEQGHRLQNYLNEIRLLTHRPCGKQLVSLSIMSTLPENWVKI